jgi:phosphatidylglycerophosphate synthase
LNFCALLADVPDLTSVESVKKIENSPFDPLVKRLFPRFLPYVPQWVSPNIISTLGLVAAIACFLFLYLSRYSHWYVLAAAMGVFCHWFADTLDGEVARARGSASALGYFLDIFFDSLAVVFIGLGVFLIPGSHFVIGAVIVVVYLLLIIGGLIKAQLTDITEFPVFGPTEIHLTVFLVLVAHIWLDFGQPLTVWPELVGDHGWLTGLLGMDGGLCSIDVVGLFIIMGCVILLIIEGWRTAVILSRMDNNTSRP